MTGGKKCIANLAIKESEITAANKVIITQWANEVLRESMMMCPVDTGFLRRSGRVAVSDGLKFSVQIGFTAEYAMKVHEIPMNHKVGQWKFLETPFNSLSPKLKTALKAGIMGVV